MFKKERVIKYLSIATVGIIFLSVFILYNISSKSTYKDVSDLNDFTHQNNDIDELTEESIEVSSVTENFYEDDNILDDKIFVEVKGEVVNPNVYEIKKGSIVKDLIDISGGLTSQGSVDNINQARELVDGECIIVYSKDEIERIQNDSSILNYDNSLNKNNVQTSNDSEQDDIININTADKEELMTLNGVGDVLAESIIAYREENKGFSSIEDIKNVPRIGDKTFNKFKDKIKV